MANRTRSRRTSRRTPPPRTPVDAERSLLGAIADGELDAHLGAIAAAVDARRRLLHTIDSSHTLATLCVGDRVRINQRVSPRYLAGLDGTVIEIDDRAATIRLDHPGRALRERSRALPAAGARADPRSRLSVSLHAPARRRRSWRRPGAGGQRCSRNRALLDANARLRAENSRLKDELALIYGEQRQARRRVTRRPADLC